MAPLLSSLHMRNFSFPLHGELLTQSTTSVMQLQTQWRNPGEILSLLLLLAPDVIQRSIAQLAGQRLTPVAFSFGWVAYSVSALLTTIGDRRLMPSADYKSKVIVAKSGHIRQNESWVIGRLLRDFERRQSPLVADKSSEHWEALRVSIFKIIPGSEPGRPIHDYVWFSGLGIILLQLGLAVVPLCLSGEWPVLVITTCGTLVALSHGALAQWREEKWECPKTGSPTVTITQGNGSRHAMVILGSDSGLHLEILARSDGNLSSSFSTRIGTAVQAMLWMVLLITVAGLKQGSWYLLAIGTIGMLHNIFVAQSPRQPKAFGIHTELVATISEKKVSKVLAKVEEQYPLVGLSLLPVFYPAGFRAPQDEKKFWKEASKRRHKAIANICLDESNANANVQEQKGRVEERQRACVSAVHQPSKDASDDLNVVDDTLRGTNSEDG
ncbi:hypothetical protein N7G274_007240 [Stereocaulon virgatum]|uniref:Uncharacterized protein n=1 Tax=Stereocaulon virgatum TaxID=373712 RepID=A0ABR4A1J8_9LECA